MKATLVILAAALAVIAASPSPSDVFDVSSHAAPINAVVGDASWIAAFGRAPDAGVPDDVRITTHLTWVLGRLRAAPVGHLDAAGRVARVRNLDRLAQYIREGRFPRNPQAVRVRTPNFIDDQGRICAVGHLLRADLGAAAATAIRDRFQFARIREMTSAALAEWARSSGLSVRELAMIQPEYCPDGTPGCAGNVVGPDSPRTGVLEPSFKGATFLANTALAGVNGIGLARGNSSRALAWIGIGTGLVGGIAAALDGSDSPLLGASAGILSSVVGMAALRHREGPPGATSAVSLSVGPTALGASAIAVNLRF